MVCVCDNVGFSGVPQAFQDRYTRNEQLQEISHLYHYAYMTTWGSQVFPKPFKISVHVMPKTHHGTQFVLRISEVSPPSLSLPRASMIWKGGGAHTPWNSCGIETSVQANHAEFLTWKANATSQGDPEPNERGGRGKGTKHPHQHTQTHPPGEGEGPRAERDPPMSLVLLSRWPCLESPQEYHGAQRDSISYGKGNRNTGANERERVHMRALCVCIILSANV